MLVLIIGLIAYRFLAVPELPENSDDKIVTVLSSDVPEFIKGETGYVTNDGIKIWYESILPSDTIKGAILLFMGISNDAMGWPQPFVDNLVQSGYQVIRYDYRGTGFLDWAINWKDNPYSLEDLAKDSKVIIDSLIIDKVNLVGISLGGMVAQEQLDSTIDLLPQRVKI